jgi:hypothetical protein
MTCTVTHKQPGAVYWAEFTKYVLYDEEFLLSVLAACGLEITGRGPETRDSQFLRIHDQEADDGLNDRTVLLFFEMTISIPDPKEHPEILTRQYKILERKIIA